ncbi:MAG: DNA/RNA non-specific endonuclease [bacterium]|nr:DNA/RNA non-specific endonuclease [bacterium]
MRRAFVLLIAIFTLAGDAIADYVEVRRSVTIKAQPEGGAAILARPPVGTHLALIEPGQTNGYYHVRIPAGLGAHVTEGFVFRNRVRGFPGDPPGTEPTSTTTATSDVVYRGIPGNEFPEFPITVLDKGHFVVGYSEDFLNPAWVFYRIGPAVDFRSFPRPGFRIDRDTESQVRTQDYTHSGFDRGHMAPNFAMGSRFGPGGARSTFVMSNVSPQFHSFNDGQWGDLEEWIAGRKPPNATAENFIRGWADQLEEVWVVVGPLFDEERDPLDSGVPVPSGFFCIVVDELENGQPRALAFIMPHLDQRVDELTGFLTTVDEVERRGGLDFFPLLPNSVEDAMELTPATELWPLPVAPN